MKVLFVSKNEYLFYICAEFMYSKDLTFKRCNIVKQKTIQNQLDRLENTAKAFKIPESG